MKEWKLDASKLDPAKAKYLVGYDPAEAKKLLAEAGHKAGLTVPMFHWPGYAPPWRTYFDLAADNLGQDRHQRRVQARGVRQVHLHDLPRQVREDGDGPDHARSPRSTTGSTARFHPEQPNNRSHVADAELSKLLVAQRRELDPKKRLVIVHDIQRYLADKAYYVYLPHSPQYITHAPHVKGIKYHDGFGARPAADVHLDRQVAGASTCCGGCALAMPDARARLASSCSRSCG